MDMFRAITTKESAQKAETFEEAKCRHRLSDAEIQQLKKVACD